METTQVQYSQDNNLEDDALPGVSAVVQRSARLAHINVHHTYEEVDNHDELDDDSSCDEQAQEEYQFASDESDYQWNMTPVSHGTIHAMGSPDDRIFLESNIPSPMVSPPRHTDDQESVSSASFLDADASPFHYQGNVVACARRNLHGVPVLSSGGRHFSEPGLVENPDRVLNFGANYANSWHGDVVPPPLNSPIPIPPSSPVVPPPSLLG